MHVLLDGMGRTSDATSDDAFPMRFFAMAALSGSYAPTAIGGIADGVRRSTADTLERG